MTGPFKVSEAYADRRIRFDGVRDYQGWKVKTYSIIYGDEPLEPNTFKASAPA